MKWESGRRSRNIEDRRGMGVPGRGMGVPGGGATVGGGLGALVLALLVAFLGGDPSIVLQPGQPVSPYSNSPQTAPLENSQTADFVSVVLADTEDTWQALFQQEFGAAYQEPNLVLFSGAVQSACGYAQSAMGPFYCPGDQKVYLDMSFFDDLKNRHQAPGDFAQAYVIAHEVGHHVQNLLGISDQVHRLQQQVRPAEANGLSVRLELQADCLAGVWAYHAQEARQILESGDVEEALNAASQIGDDRLQLEARGYVTPDSFTHGSSQQRTEWFERGIRTGELAACNTFDAASL